MSSIRSECIYTEAYLDQNVIIQMTKYNKHVSALLNMVLMYTAGWNVIILLHILFMYTTSWNVSIYITW